MTKKMISLTPEMKDAVAKVCKEKGLTETAFILIAIDEKLKAERAWKEK